MRVGILGINHKLADLKLRELLAKACYKRFSGESSLYLDIPCVLLSTCNRTEVYFSFNDLPEAHTRLLNLLRREVKEDFDQKLYSYFGLDCFLHLSRVTAGLDSAIVAETEVQGQVKSAYQHALSIQSLPNELHYLFQKCLKVGKQIRSSFLFKTGMKGLEDAVYQTGCDVFSNPQESKVLFVGASAINQKILHFLQQKNCQSIFLCNRSLLPAQQMAEKYPIKVLPWEAMQTWHNFDWVIFGTKATNFLLSPKDTLQEYHSHKLVIDLSVPRNVDPMITKHPLITLLNIDELNQTLTKRKQELAVSLQKAETIAKEAAKRQVFLFHQKIATKQKGFA